MTFYEKIKAIAETLTGYSVTVDTRNGANVDFDRLDFPCVLIIIQESGNFNTVNSHYRDTANVSIMLLNKIPLGFKDVDIDTLKDTLKKDLITLHHSLRYNFDFKINTTTLNYNVVYDEFDSNLIGLVFNDTITERVGVNMACNTPPQPQKFTVEIIDQYGNVIKTFTSSGNYTVTTLSAIQQVIGNTSTTVIQNIIN
jgi:hypothetical protein